MKSERKMTVNGDEAGELLGVSKQTVNKYRKAGLLAAVDMAAPGSQRPQYRYQRSALQEFLDRRTTKTMSVQSAVDDGGIKELAQ